MKKSDFLLYSPKHYRWPRCPEAEKFIRQTLNQFLKTHSFSAQLSRRMMKETSTDFLVWVDHLVLPRKKYSEAHLKHKAGITEEMCVVTPWGYKPMSRPFADLPRFLLSDEADEISCAIVVDSIEHFKKVHRLKGEIEGQPYSTYRRMVIPGKKGNLYIVERRGTLNFIPDQTRWKKKYLKGVITWAKRRRQFPTDSAGMRATLSLAKKMVKELGVHLGACAFLEGERIYWQSRNRAGRVQKSRQDRLGLGWANHDHHTFRSSRAQFPALIKILLTFGFKKRERFYAGAEAGWGAQVMENPVAGLIIFADVDLTPKDIQVDFSSRVLPSLLKPGTVGLWCALHGESMLQAGMHHLEAQFDFNRLKRDLKKKQIKIMNPFSNWTFLRQAFTKGEQWKVSPKRLLKLKKKGAISIEAYKKIKRHGAVDSHLENLQRKEGFKGFNQRGVSHIITEVNPERQAMKKAA